MSSNNNTGSRFEKLQEENWRLTYRLDDDLRAKFNSEDCYLFGLGGAHFGGPLNCEAG